MPFNGVGVFTGLNPPTYPAVAGTVIDPTYFNNIMADIFGGLTNAVTRNGQSPATANLPMGGFKHTGCADATANDQYATYGQLQSMVSGGIDLAADYTWTGYHNHVQNADPNILSPWYDTFKVSRTSDTAAVGVNPNVRAAMLVDVKVINGTQFFEWGIVSRVSNYESANPIDTVGITGQGYKYTTAGRSWGMVAEAQDFSGNSGAGILVGLEVDVFANGTTGATSRVGAEFVFGKADNALLAPTIAAGIRLSPSGGTLSNAGLTNGIEMNINCSNAVINIFGNSGGTYFLDALYSSGWSKFLRFYSGAMPAFQLASSGGTLGTYVGRFLIDIDGYTYWFPIYG